VKQNTKPTGNQFQQLAAKCPLVCDICGEPMHAMPGDGWDNDRIVCAARDCGAEIEFPTSGKIEPERDAQ
jgi:hypothetical protein